MEKSIVTRTHKEAKRWLFAIPYG